MWIDYLEEKRTLAEKKWSLRSRVIVAALLSWGFFLFFLKLGQAPTDTCPVTSMRFAATNLWRSSGRIV